MLLLTSRLARGKLVRGKSRFREDRFCKSYVVSLLQQRSLGASFWPHLLVAQQLEASPFKLLIPQNVPTQRSSVVDHLNNERGH